MAMIHKLQPPQMSLVVKCKSCGTEVICMSPDETNKAIRGHLEEKHLSVHEEALRIDAKMGRMKQQLAKASMAFEKLLTSVFEIRPGMISGPAAPVDPKQGEAKSTIH